MTKLRECAHLVVGVAADGGPPGSDVVDVLVAVHVVCIRALHAVEDNWVAAHGAEGADGRVYAARQQGLRLGHQLHFRDVDTRRQASDTRSEESQPARKQEVSPAEQRTGTQEQPAARDGHNQLSLAHMDIVPVFCHAPPPTSWSRMQSQPPET